MRRHSDSTDSSNSRHNRHRSRKDFKQEDSDDEDSTVTLQKGRKRLRGSQAKTPERKPSMPQSMRMRSLRIGDTAEVTKFYEGRFRDIQQAACKIIAKAFIKVVEPRKQTNFPYTGGVDRAPAWWPTEARVGAPHGVKHKEPDHLLKPGNSMFKLNRLLTLIPCSTYYTSRSYPKACSYEGYGERACHDKGASAENQRSHAHLV